MHASAPTGNGPSGEARGTAAAAAAHAGAGNAGGVVGAVEGAAEGAEGVVDGAAEAALPVQWVVLRKDLKETWPAGALVAQACHASLAAVWQSRDDAATVLYLAEMDRMHKVVLEVKNVAALEKLSATLTANGVGHKLWIEQPENIATCLATAPVLKADVGHLFKKLRLCS
ncbi:peptidyl-tRNA hydrolase II domain-containing protein [Pelagophyceae sp. CCMP2097]|nr:peptidyl-tRNA hydrolase II domain-containing protein [Pelagophyceae sp. CCMP2097]